VRYIAHDLKVYSRAEADEAGPVDVRKILESTVRMARGEIRQRTNLVQDFAPVPDVIGHEARLGQVFLNLVVNAIQALPSDGPVENTIRIATFVDPDGSVVVSVEDSGSGIPQDVLPRIFDPFFTTKPAGVGTGLGLAICHRIVTQLGGRMTVDSHVGRGTVVRTLLRPALGRPARRTATTPRPLETTRIAHILVIDDEPTLLAAVKRMLGRHEVTITSNGADALAMVEHGPPFDVILCDMLMPEMSGMELHAAIGRISKPQADNMVFMTGGSFSERAQDFLARSRNPVLEKPFDGSELRKLVDRLMHTRSPSWEKTPSS
jgi:CheY-like chemotaxis protein